MSAIMRRAGPMPQPRVKSFFGRKPGTPKKPASPLPTTAWRLLAAIQPATSCIDRPDFEAGFLSWDRTWSCWSSRRAIGSSAARMDSSTAADMGFSLLVSRPPSFRGSTAVGQLSPVVLLLAEQVGHHLVEGVEDGVLLRRTVRLLLVVLLLVPVLVLGGVLVVVLHLLVLVLVDLAGAPGAHLDAPPGRLEH